MFFFQGRTDHGQVDQKGILGDVFLDGMKISPDSWKVSPVPLTVRENVSSKGTLIFLNQSSEWKSQKMYISRISPHNSWKILAELSKFCRPYKIGQILTSPWALLISKKYFLSPAICDPSMPSFYVGYFKIPSCPPLSSFLKVTGGWSKGVAAINGFGLGRYWPDMGPQVRAETKISNHVLVFVFTIVDAVRSSACV